MFFFIVEPHLDYHYIMKKTTVIDFGMAVNSYILIITVTNNVVKAKYLRPSSDIMFLSCEKKFDKSHS